MMKNRNTEGFALAYVVIVIFILCALSIALMSMTLRTLQAQEKSVQRMQDKYEAQGEIERLVAELEAECENLSNNNYSSHASAELGAKTDFINYVRAYATTTSGMSFNEVPYGDAENPQTDYFIIVEATSSNDSIDINAILQLDFSSNSFETDIDSERNLAYDQWTTNPGPEESNPHPEFLYDYKITNVTFVFTSYEIGGGT